MSTAAPTISFSGLASGLDTTSIISQLTTTAQIPVTSLNKQITGYNSQLSDWQTFNANLAALQTAVTTLSNQSTLNAPTASSSNPAAATLTSQVGAAIGSHSLSVTQLAQAQEVASASQSSGTTALGQTGSFTLNGKTVQISAGDALQDVASKINGAGAGVTASVVDVGTNDYRLTLTSTQTGTVNSIAAADTGGTVLSNLGLIQSGTASIRQGVSYTQGGTAYAGAASLTLTSATQSVGSLLGIAAGNAPSGTFHLSNGGSGAGSGADIAVDLNADSLTSIANAINHAGVSGVSAEVVTVPDANGNLNRIQQLRIVGSGSTAPAFTDTSGVLATVGVLQNAYTDTVTEAQDAKFKLDGLNLTRSTNTVNDAIPSATIGLVSAGTTAAPATTTLSVTQNTAAVVQAVNSFASAYNAVQDFVTNENKFTAPTTTVSGAAGTNPALFGNTTLTQIQQTLSSALTAVSGTKTLQSIGITLNGSSDLTVDSNALTTALQADPNVVSGLFGLSGTSDSATIHFVAGSAKSVASSGTGFPVVITQPATQSSGTAAASGSGAASTAPETLSFGGPLFPTAAKLTIPAGSTIQQTAALINASSGLNTQIYASVDAGNHLVLASQSYGSTSGFTVFSDAAASAANSGVGPSLSVTAGKDVAGTINGEAAIGIGRTLTGSLTDSHAAGVQLLVTATAPTPAGGTPGHVTVTHGVADGLNAALTQILDPTTGSVIGAENGLNSEVSSAQAQITQIQTTVDNYKAYLTQIFSEMETRVSALQAQGSAFTASFGSSTTTSSGTGTAKTSS